MEANLQTKQSYLKNNIPQESFESFIAFCTEQVGYYDLQKWTFEKVQQIANDYIQKISTQKIQGSQQASALHIESAFVQDNFQDNQPFFQSHHNKCPPSQNQTKNDSEPSAVNLLNQVVPEQQPDPFELFNLKTPEQAETLAELVLQVLFQFQPNGSFCKKQAIQFFDNMYAGLTSVKTSSTAKVMMLRVLKNFNFKKIQIYSVLSGHQLLGFFQSQAQSIDPYKQVTEKGFSKFPEQSQIGNEYIKLILELLTKCSQKYAKNKKSEPTRFLKIINELKQKGVIVSDECLKADSSQTCKKEDQSQQKNKNIYESPHDDKESFWKAVQIKREREKKIKIEDQSNVKQGENLSSESLHMQIFQHKMTIDKIQGQISKLRQTLSQYRFREMKISIQAINLKGKNEIMRVFKANLKQMGITPQSVFRIADIHYQRQVDSDHFHTVLSGLKLGLFPKQISTLIYIFDENCNSFISQQDYNEALQGYQVAEEESQKAQNYKHICLEKLAGLISEEKIEAEALYQLIDRKKQGSVDLNLLEGYVKKHFGSQIQEKEIVGAFHAMDLESNGVLDKQNFVYGINSTLQKISFKNVPIQKL